MDTFQQGSGSSRKPLFDSVEVSPFSTHDSAELEVIDYNMLGGLSEPKSTSKSSKKNLKSRSKANQSLKKEENSRNSKKTFNEDHHAVPFDYSTLDSRTQSNRTPKSKTKEAKKSTHKDKKSLQTLTEDTADGVNDITEVLTAKTPLKRTQKASLDKDTTKNAISRDIEVLADSVKTMGLNTNASDSCQQTLPKTPSKLSLKSDGQDGASKTLQKDKQASKKPKSKKKSRHNSDVFSKIGENEAIAEDLDERKDRIQLAAKSEINKKTPKKDPSDKQTKRSISKSEAESKEANQDMKTANKTPRKQNGLKNDSGSTPVAKSTPARNVEGSGKNIIRDPHDQGSTPNSAKRRQRSVYQKYLTTKEVAAGLKNGTIHRGMLRINKRNRLDAYVTSEHLGQDIYIYGMNLRNRALEGDSVAVILLEGEKLKHAKEQRSRDAQKRGRVLLDELENGVKIIFGEIIHIFERSNGNNYSGTLVVNGPTDSANRDKKRIKLAWFKPSDKRIPYIMIPLRETPKDFIDNPETYKNLIVVASISDWPTHSLFPFGKIIRKIGAIGNVASETEALLSDNNVRTEDFGPEVKQCLPELPWTIPKSELKNRRDLRQERVFTIDPSTAKDLDDAVSCRKLPDGNLEIGVHIADVSYFVKPGTALDREAKLRATTVYLVEKAIPMLPNILCQELCSLNPGVDRLAFSVMWKMTPDAKILDVWFGRTVISSCCRLAYEQAQEVILGKSLDPTVTLYGQPREEIESDIKMFYQLSQILRQRRFENGALAINSIRLYFQLNSDGIPTTCQVYNLKESNRLIEEFMLLANISVAEKISAAYPEQAFLRKHSPPLEKRMLEFVKIAAELGYDINPETAGTLQKALNSIDSISIQHVLKALCIKPMQRAKYFCAGTSEPDTYRHYALNVPLYTHFTSPIRRYADVIVHRELQSALLGKKSFYQPTEQIQTIADHCNNKKEAAKNAQEMSSHIYLAVYLYNLTQAHGPIVCTAIIIDVVENGFDVLVPEFGLEKRVYTERLPVDSSNWDSQSKTIRIKWKKDTQVTVPQNEHENPNEMLPDIDLEDIFPDDDSNDGDDCSHLSNMDHDELLGESFEDVAQDMPLEDDAEETPKIAPYSEPGAHHSQLQEIISKPEPPQSQFLESKLNFNLNGDTQTIKIFGHVNVLVTSDISQSPAFINITAVNPLLPIGKATNPA